VAASRKRVEQHQELSLAEAAQTVLDECRMVLPGIQALFGFQLVAVFSDRFDELGPWDQRLHLVGIALVAISAALVMTPAAYHRRRGGRLVTDTFIHVASALLVASMLPLAATLGIDFFLIATLVFGSEAQAAPFAVALFAVMVFLWFIFPRMPGLHHAIARARARLSP
jgi:chloramphenicol 3-O-phosphotransferase